MVWLRYDRVALAFPGRRCLAPIHTRQDESGVRLSAKELAKPASPMRFVIYTPHWLPRTSKNHYDIARPVVTKRNVG